MHDHGSSLHHTSRALRRLSLTAPPSARPDTEGDGALGLSGSSGGGQSGGLGKGLAVEPVGLVHNLSENIPLLFQYGCSKEEFIQLFNYYYLLSVSYVQRTFPYAGDPAVNKRQPSLPPSPCGAHILGWGSICDSDRKLDGVYYIIHIECTTVTVLGTENLVYQYLALSPLGT